MLSNAGSSGNNWAKDLEMLEVVVIIEQKLGNLEIVATTKQKLGNLEEVATTKQKF